MNYKTIAAALALACAGSAYAAPRNVAFFDFNKTTVQSFASQAGSFYNHDIYVQFDESEAYRRLMQAISSNYSPPSYGGGTTTNSITAAVPEPETYAMMVAGLLIIGSVARRRRGQR